MKFLAHCRKLSPDVQGGLALLFAAIAALILANSPLGPSYKSIGKMFEPSLLFWVNEGLMTLFFLVVGLEIRREIHDGELNSFAKSALPAVAALGGMLVPAALYLWVAQGDRAALRGFGIPVATDIAFAVAVLSIFGKRVPLSLKAFLMALAIFDDIGAIVLIAIFYNHDISWLSLILAVLIAAFMYGLRRLKVSSLLPYIMLAIALWFLTLQSGIHATIAGVATAFLLPTENGLQKRLQPFVTFAILPLFAFLNAGISLGNAGFNDLMMPVSLGISLGLVVGKPLGVFLFTWLCVQFRLAPKPKGATWPQIFGIALVCGIGFTMSLFVGMLAFERSPEIYQAWVRAGVLLGSLVSAVLGCVILNATLRKP